jgi:hypothetical protein
VSQFKFGMDAIEESNAAKENTKVSNDFAKFTSGTTLKVKLTGVENVMRYYGYGIFKRVNTFIAKDPSDRNEKGYVTGNPTPWDKAAQYYYDKANKLLEGIEDDDEIKVIKDSKEYKELTAEGYKYAGKKRFAVGFIDLETGKPIIVDFTGKQFDDVIKGKLIKYDSKKDKIAFELSKTGERNNAKVTLEPVVDMDDDLTDKERENFEKAIGKEFDKKLFEGLLYEADEKEQIENLIKAGFDVSLIGYDGGGEVGNNGEEEELPF